MLKEFFIKIFKSKKVKSIQFLITVSFTMITVLAMLFVGITLYNKFTNIAVQNTSINTTQIIEQVNLNLDYYLKSMIEISNLLENNVSANNGVIDEDLKEQMSVIMETRQDIVTMGIFDNVGNLILGYPNTVLKKNVNVMNQQWYDEIYENPEYLYFSSPHVENLFQGKHNWVLSLSRSVPVVVNGKKVSGIILVDLNFESIGELCENVNLGKKGYIYIVDSAGNIVYHSQQQLIYNGLKSENTADVLKHTSGSFIQKDSGGNRMITVKPISFTDWRIVGVSYMDEITSIKNETSAFAFTILLFGIATVIIIFIFISAKISKPIKQLERSMKKVEEGCFDIYVDVKGEDEVVRLSRTFNIMVVRIRELMDQIVKEQEEKRKSELNALQAQINPHFLYNTLDSIVWMAENGNSQDVITMVTSLARLFRISISRGKNIITVEQEVEHARNYLIIQKIRYKNKFTFQFDVDERVLNYRTLKLILQPIIENSIYHGIEYMVDEGLIKISVRIEDGKLLYQVEDNGLGMDKDKLDSLLSESYESDSKSGSGVGVKNVHQRIQLYYGKEYGLKIQSELEEGTMVKIYLPLDIS